MWFEWCTILARSVYNVALLQRSWPTSCKVLAVRSQQYSRIYSDNSICFCHSCRAQFSCSFPVVVAVAPVVDAVILIQAIRSRKSVRLVLVADAVILMAVCGGYSNHDCADNDGDEYSNGRDNVRRSSKLACVLRVRHCLVICHSYTHHATQHNETCH